MRALRVKNWGKVAFKGLITSLSNLDFKKMILYINADFKERR